MEEILNQVIELDRSLLLFMNGSDSKYIDAVMMLFTGKWIWLPLVFSILFTLCLKGWKEALLIFIMIVLVATLCDQISSSFFKPFFERLRPTHEPEFSSLVKTVNNYTGGLYGFISSHAANGFGVATFIALVFRKTFFGISLFLWAIINSYTRIYLGVHYPGDIAAGALLGITIGYLVFLLYKTLRKQMIKDSLLQSSEIPFRTVTTTIILTTLYLSILFILIFAPILIAVK